MSDQQRALAHLREELRNLQVFDRVHDYATDADPANERAYAVRQARRKQIIDEIAILRASKHEGSAPIRLTAAVAFICTLGYAMLHFLLR